MSRSPEGVYYVEDVVRGQWSPNERDARIKITAEADGVSVAQWIEEEGGSSGKAQSQSLIKLLAGFTVRAERPTGDKVVRAGPFASQVQGGYVKLVQGAWGGEYVRELLSFPSGAHDDQCDASSGAFNKLATATPTSISGAAYKLLTG